MRGRRPIPRSNTLAGTRLDSPPRCPPHLSEVARKEWRRLATPLYEPGLLSLADRAALAAYCQAWGHWVEAEDHLARTPTLLKTPSGYAQQSPWLTIANKQLELMGRYMTELGLTPVARTRVDLEPASVSSGQIKRIEFVAVYNDENGNRIESQMNEAAREAMKRKDKTNGVMEVVDRYCDYT